MTTLDIIVPIYNEAPHLFELVSRIRAVDMNGVRKRIFLIDDGSSDGTAAVMARLAGEDVVALHHDRNRGKGAAVRTGLAKANGDIVLIQDADLEYDPAEYPRLIQPICDGRAKVVYGNRFHRGRPPGMGRMFWWGNRFLTALTNYRLGQRLSDMETCYKAFDRDTIAKIELVSDSFAFEPEVTAKIARLGIAIVEVPISYRARRKSEGKKIAVWDGFAAIWTLWRW